MPTGWPQAIAALAATLAACEGPPARSKPWRNAAPADDRAAGAGPATIPTLERERAAAVERRGHTLRIRLDGEPAHLNPLLDLDEEGARVVDDTVFETLVRWQPSGYEPGLAESWRVTNGGLEVRLTLRAGVHFHDGTPLTAEDVQYTIDAARAANGRAARLRAALADVASIDVWGPRDLRVELRRPDGYVLRALAEVAIVPAHLYKTDFARRNRAPVGTGPYKLVRWSRGDRIVLARNDAYWGPPPAIGDVEYAIISDGARALVAAEQGEIDILPALIPEHWPEQAARGDLVDLTLKPPRFQALVLNTRRPPFDDARVRQAVSLLMDRARIARDALRGLARPIAAPIWPGGPGDGEALPAPLYDAVRAQSQLDQAGWRAGEDGSRSREGGKLHAVFLCGADPRDDAERDIVVGGLRKAGFTVEVRAGDAAAVTSRLRAGDFDAALVEVRGRSDEDLAPLFGTTGALNWGGYSSKPVDAALADLRAAWDPRERAARIGRLARLVVDDQPIVSLIAPDPHGLVARRIQGLNVRDGWFAIRELGFVP